MGHLIPFLFSFVCFAFWLSLFHVAVAHFASSLQPVLCVDDERSALLQFKDSFIIDNDFYFICDSTTSSKVVSWNLEEENSDCCSWDGVKCAEETGHVIGLDLSGSCLRGSINSTSTLFRLVHLEWLSLADNFFNNSEIPAAINNLSRLSHLNLSFGYFTGQIPAELLELPNLESLDLSDNYNTRIPDNETCSLELRQPSLQILVEKLTNLKLLNLDGVQISSPIPHILANLSSLTYLSLQYCGFQGELPTKMFHLPNLSVLKLSDNRNLTGYLPEFEGSPLTFFSIGSCGLSGTIPSSLGNLTKLVHLDFSFNYFSGELPSSISRLGSLKELLLEGCSFSGQISSPLGNLTQLTYLDLSHSYNKFSGQSSSSLSWIAMNTKLITLDLSNLNLLGEIPFWLKNLTELTYLDMRENQLTGPIPSFLMNLNQLSFLYLQSNRLTGYIPAKIGNLTQLIQLDLSSNSFQGPIPSTFGELKNLLVLRLQSNNMSGTVEVDMFLSRLQSLEILVLSSNNFSVLVANTNANTTSQKLRNIGLSSCNVSQFPNFLYNQTRLTSLDLSSNKMSGQIPRWILNATMHWLAYLNLSHNHFTGFDSDQRPIVLQNRLITLDLRFNKLEGPLPIPGLSMVEILVSNNKFTGQISPLICDSRYLYALDLSNNNLSGMLPQCLANFSDDLTILALKGNKFHGTLPQTFINGSNLRMIDLSNNKLQGRLPRSLVNCTKLEYLNLGNNQINDIFPSWLGSLQELKVLILKSNRLHGAIKEPGANSQFSKLQVIDLSHNMFGGELPTKYLQNWNAMKVVNRSQLTYMQNEMVLYTIGDNNQIYLSFYDYAYSMTISNKGIALHYEKISRMLSSIILSGNKFVGEIPACIASLKGLNNLNLSYNNLKGHIPSSLGNLIALESLDLSSNRLSGNIPQQLAEITSLEVFNVSYNRLAGPIPQGKQFSTFENSSFDGNQELCGKPLSKICKNFEPLKKKGEDFEALFVFDWKIILIGFVGGLIVGVVLGLEFYTRQHEWFEFYTRQHEWFMKIFGMQIMKRRRRCRN